MQDKAVLTLLWSGFSSERELMFHPNQANIHSFTTCHFLKNNIPLIFATVINKLYFLKMN